MNTYSELKIENRMRSRPVILLGMHRSGTSLTVRLLRDLGIYMGYFFLFNAEAFNFQKLNRRIFAEAGAQWSHVDPILNAMNSQSFVSKQVSALQDVLFEGRRLRKPGLGTFGLLEHYVWKSIYEKDQRMWGWKDPRTTLTFPIWQPIFPQAKFVHIVRNGVDVAISINRRTQKNQGHWWQHTLFNTDYSPQTLDFEQCFSLWEKYVAFVLDHKHLIPREQYYELHYEDLLRDPHVELRSLVDFLEYEVETDLLDETCAQINAGRLNNTVYAARYKKLIPALACRPLMQRLGYDYQLE